MVASSMMTWTFTSVEPYRRRVIDNDLDSLFGALAAILLDGAKGVGKTTTGRQRCVTYRRLDRSAERAAVEADPAIILGDPRPALIDEWQRVPEVWDVVRAHVDDDHTPSQFLLAGSLPGKGTHSGAGRIAALRMRPLSLPERGASSPTVSLAALLDGGRPVISGRTTMALDGYVDEIMAGGFPGLRHLSGRALQTQLDGYIDRIVDHDMPEAGYNVRRPDTVRRWLRAYAAATATTTTFEKIRDAASPGSGGQPPAKTTALGYTELLTRLRILDPLEAWRPGNGHLRRLGASPKHHLVDPALSVRLLGRTKQHLLIGDDGPAGAIPRDGTLLGGLFESLACLSVRTFAQATGGSTYHLREKDGRREIDFIVERDARVLGIEVKLSSAIDDKDVRHLLWLADEMGEDVADLVVLTTGPEAYRRPDGVAVVPLALLGP
jgi:predicted AAA+ superfamily ATPase